MLEVRRGGQHIGHIQSRDRVLPGVGQAQDAPNDLLHIHLTGAVCQRCKDVGKGAVPALLQCVDGDDESYGAVGRKQICIFQLVDVGGLNGNLLCRNAVFYKDGADLFKSGSVLFALGLCLKQHDGADVAAAVAVFCHGLCLQNALHLDSVVQHIQLIVAVHYEHRQLDHVLLTQMNRIHNGDQVALLGGGSSQIQHKARVEIPKHLLAQSAAGMVTLVHDHHRAKLVDDLQQGGGVGILHRVGRSAQSLRQLCQTAVLLPCLELLFLASEGIVGQHQNRKLLGNGRDVEPCGRQQLVFGVDLHPAVECHINFLAVGVRRVPQGRKGLGEDGIRGHQPDHHTLLHHAQCMEDRLNGVGGKEGFAAAGGHLQADVCHARQKILIPGHSTRSHRNVFFFPQAAVGGFDAARLHQNFKIPFKVTDHGFLIILQFHFCRPPYTRTISRGIFLNVMPSCCNSCSLRVQRSA